MEHIKKGCIVVRKSYKKDILFFSVNKKIKVDRTKADINNIGTY